MDSDALHPGFLGSPVHLVVQVALGHLKDPLVWLDFVEGFQIVSDLVRQKLRHLDDPKTPKSVRVIQMPQFLTDEIKDYLKSLYKVQPDQRIFEVTKSYLHHEMDRGAKEARVKRIRIHDLRHPYVKPTTKKFITFFEVFRAAS